MTPQNELNVIYDNGVHIPGSILWFDPTRKREFCAASSARIAVTDRQVQVLWSDRTASLRNTVGARRNRGLVAPYHRSFSIGSLTLELFPSGYMAGASQFDVTTSDGARFIYSGPFSLTANLTAEKIELRKADTVIVDATYGHKRFVFPKREQVYTEIIDWITDCRTRNTVPVLLAANPGKTQDLIQRLGSTGIDLRVHRTIYTFNKAYRDIGIDLPHCKHFGGATTASDVVIWPSQLRQSPVLQKLPNAEFAAISGLGVIPGIEKRLNVSLVFTLSARSDFKGILSYIKKTGATRVFTVGTHAEDLCLALEKKGMISQALHKTPQLSLELSE